MSPHRKWEHHASKRRRLRYFARIIQGAILSTSFEAPSHRFPILPGKNRLRRNIENISIRLTQKYGMSSGLPLLMPLTIHPAVISWLFLKYHKWVVTRIFDITDTA